MTEIMDLASVIPDDQIQKFTEEDVRGLTGLAEWLPRVAINGAGSDAAKEGKLPVGTHALIWGKDKLLDLGKSFEFLAIAFRPRAMRVKEVPPISYFNRNSAEFQKVQVDSKVQNSGCMYGLEFLIWIPAAETFAQYFFGNPTMRRVAPALLAVMKNSETDKYRPSPAMSEIKYIKNNKTGFSWHGADIHPVSTPLAPPDDPDEWTLRLQDEVKKFNNPPESAVEKVDAPDSRER